MSVQDVVKRLNEVQSKIETFKTLLVDPDLAEYVRGLSLNGAGRTTVNHESVRLPSESSERNGLKAAILGLSLPPQFSVEHVVKGLEAAQFDFEGRAPIGAVRDSLYAAAKNQRGIRLAKKGNRNGKPNLYEKTL